MERVVEVNVATIVELFRTMEYGIRDLEKTRGRRAVDATALARTLGRLDAMKELMMKLAPHECAMASWEKEGWERDDAKNIK